MVALLRGRGLLVPELSVSDASYTTGERRFAMRLPRVITATFILTLAACEGPPGAPGISGYEIVVGETALDAGATKQLQVDCPEGKRTLGAGWSVLDSTSAILSGRVTYSEPSFDGSHWLANAQNESQFSPMWKLRLRVICAVVEE
jgi:hypothetical protein